VAHLKRRWYRIALLLSSLAALVAATGADSKWH
jgi:hypothetical protein